MSQSKSGVGPDKVQADSTRGQSEVIGVVLVFGMVVLGATAVVMFGASAIDDTNQQLSMDRAETTLTQFDSEAALVALGEADARTVSLPTATEGQYTVNEDAGWMKVSITNRTGTTKTLMNTTMGKLIYEADDRTIAYQGGGVWRASEAGGTMISPPEFHYRSGTLTLPAVNITGNGHIGSEASVRHTGTKDVYPDTARDETWSNPLTDNKIHITIQSGFYRAWGQYFEQRINSEVTFIDDENKVKVTLVPPPQPVTIDSGIVAAGDLDIDGTPSDRVTGGVSLGGTTGSESAIEGAIEENVTANTKLETAASKLNASYSRLENETGPSDTSTVDAGKYFVNNDDLFNDQTTFDTSSGDIEVFVDGDLDTGSKDLDVTGDGDVKIYANGTFHMSGQPAWGDASHVTSLTVYSREVDRITEFYGVIYTDAVEIKGAGHDPDLLGAVVSTADTVTMGGNVDIEYGTALANSKLQEVEVEFAKISYLHISQNEIEIE